MDGFAGASRLDDEMTSGWSICPARITIDWLIRKRAGSIEEAFAQNSRNQDKFDEAIPLQQHVIALRRRNVGSDRRAKPVVGVMGNFETNPTQVNDFYDDPRHNAT